MSNPPPAVNGRALYVSQGSPVLPDGTQTYPSVDRAATITELDPDDPYRVGLSVTNPTGLHFRPLSEGGSLYDASGTTPGSWHWADGA